MTKNDKPKELKVTDKRIFTPEGDLREEFRDEIKPADPMAAKPAETPAEKPAEKKADRREPPREERRRTIADKAQNPGTAFTEFVEPLIAQAYMSLGMLRNPYQPKPQIDTSAARQMIEILTMLKEKTNGNLTADEDDFLSTHLGELKLAFVQRTKSI
ncbi:MAG TPA: DUF1844 domain-containing protein [Thermoanaerobaculia bacterium]|nr:DUF1844 domain-containing protein [Thermoanaerobaculia bacterium]